MTNNTQLVCVPRELLERLQLALSNCYCPETSVTTDLWKLLAAPAEDVRAVVEEPVATVVTTRSHSLPMIMSDGSLKSGAVVEQKSAILHADLPDLTPLYRHPQRPVELPERYERLHVSEYRAGWNACLDAVEELNK
jgi:hypothetical protein